MKRTHGLDEREMELARLLMADETRQVCFYQYYDGNRQQIDETETRLIINELYDTSSFLEARNIWYTKYVNSTGVY